MPDSVLPKDTNCQKTNKESDIGTSNMAKKYLKEVRLRWKYNVSHI